MQKFGLVWILYVDNFVKNYGSTKITDVGRIQKRVYRETFVLFRLNLVLGLVLGFLGLLSIDPYIKQLSENFWSYIIFLKLSLYYFNLNTHCTP